ncbi:bifunctional DNA-binding transcriptional regulator/O6-methylguanine-DNA methyltransferase Ada [Asticcacaulis solisilvae]|uniref:bifunctional DNA-binding transcriptional regulator/O6-methylguanine-DNA methyltransferase Ada n=1 Tax=Asticcacaulis solisilvae TaxID=1217274 RepID=UPI003FD818A3
MMTSDTDARWDALVRRDRDADGLFVYAVTTTGVYCRPSCSARTPRPENVRFFAGGEAAVKAGFRACRRCKPEGDGRADMIAAACRAIETAEDEPSLDVLAAEAELSPFHFHRVFKAATGLTPKAYAKAHRRKRVREELGKGGTVTEALYDAGFGSNGRFYAETNAMLGMTPKRFKAGGADTEIRFAVGESSLGPILVAESDLGIVAVTLGDDAGSLVRELQDRFPNARLIGGDAAFEKRVAKVVGAVEKPGTGKDLPLDIRGTAFQQRVWSALRQIPAGDTVTYAELAEKIGDPKAVRAVAGACAANTLAVLIPCHRVIRTDGSLSGYRWGVERKRDLLAREGV